MINRSIVILPEFTNIHFIDELRNKYDPLVNHIKPHITVVFPFKSDIDGMKLEEHIRKKIIQVKPFELCLRGIIPIYEGKYLFLNIEKGKKRLIEIHNNLYKDILKIYLPDWLRNNEFLPHMTVGCFEKLDEFEKAIEETKNFDYSFECIIENIYVEIIDEEENSEIELNINLK